MGNNCTNCCNNIEKKLKQMSEDEVELKITNNRQTLAHNNLSMIVEDAYESQLSQQNSHLGISMQVQSNTLNSINTGVAQNNSNLTNFWILDIQERLVIVSNVNEPNLHMKIQVSFNEQTEEFCLFEEIACIGSNSTNSSLTSLNLKGQQMGNTAGANLKELNSITLNANSPSNAQNNNNTQHVSQEQLKFIANKKYHCYPFERQISQFYQIHFEKQETKVERINDFQTLDDMQFTIIETWKEILKRVFKLAGIQQNCNLVIINNFLRFARQASQLNAIAEMLLKFVFEQLKVARFSICSSGVPILKFVNKKNGIVFDILESGYIFCLPVNQGSSLDSKFRIIFAQPNTSFYVKNETDFVMSQGQLNHFQVIPTQQNNSILLQGQSQALAASGNSVMSKKGDSIQKDIQDFLESLDHEFAISCFKSQSVVINNQCKNDFIQASILQVLNQFYMTTNPPQEDQIMNIFQPIIPKQPRNTRVFGTADLLKLNVIETISKSRYERLGSVEIIKQNIFL
ncbi:hypothetical protein TTHERM_00370990 (macronuclear) [Tetrahymena thermophila SB210]|uniref:Uncharacterized protein n=1 Tax=Tetrahymena thermophila (strain SB210) TaxID=312017 RepID=I7M0K4_TETTS|nr:hypothetical protein TTHERM_00370990 [Tetrahymena thermophila SB210]EAR89284.1 hypothetical protein TTHERM_00370990 [Tetrahymena thermophila SB210]|eukprot:XP_001009529.1 hypothetical protein TTHERM_00370990 [Tetrahymena thermophila SB210]